MRTAAFSHVRQFWKPLRQFKGCMGMISRNKWSYVSTQHRNIGCVRPCLASPSLVETVDVAGEGDDILLICEHASNELPENYQWPTNDIARGLPTQHWAIDLGEE